jgi:GNAT superfamily N-acetyltransferase
MRVAIRPATMDDRDAVVALLLAQLREHAIDLPEAALARGVRGVLRHPGRGLILVAIAGRRPVGVAALSFVWPLEPGGRSVWLEELYVEPARRGRGIGRRLLRAACAAAAERGAVAVDLEVDAGHARAARLYAREGFSALPRARWVRRLVSADGARGRRSRGA